MRVSALLLMPLLGGCPLGSSTLELGEAPPTGELADGQTDGEDTDTPSSPGTDTYCYFDDDLDGYGLTASKVECSAVSGSDWVTSGGDCNDANAAISPGDAEVAGNGLDDDCDGAIDESASTTVYYRDNDGDGWGSSTYGTTTTATTGYVSTSTDCDDADTSVYPGATETADGEDDDCDGSIDEGITTSTCASTDSMVAGSFVAPVGSTIVSLSGEAVGGSNSFGWTTLSTGTPSGMTVTTSVGSGSTSKNVVSFTHAACTADTSAWNMSVTYTTSSGVTAYDCQGGAFTGTWSVTRDGVADTVTVSNNSGGGCDGTF